MEPSDIMAVGGGSQNFRNSTKITHVHQLTQGHRWKNYSFDQRVEVHFGTS